MNARWDPFRDAMSLREAMDRLLEQSIISPRGGPGPVAERRRSRSTSGRPATHWWCAYHCRASSLRPTTSTLASTAPRSRFARGCRTPPARAERPARVRGRRGGRAACPLDRPRSPERRGPTRGRAARRSGRRPGDGAFRQRLAAADPAEGPDGPPAPDQRHPGSDPGLTEQSRTRRQGAACRVTRRSSIVGAAVPNPFSLIDRLEIDFELPPVPGPLARADQWFNRLSELQRIGVALMVMLFLAASACYCLGLGSTVLVNRAEAELAAQEAELAASLPTVEPTPVEPGPTATQIVIPTEIPTLRPTARATQIADYPTPIPAQLLPTVPLQPPSSGRRRRPRPPRHASWRRPSRRPPPRPLGVPLRRPGRTPPVARRPPNPAPPPPRSPHPPPGPARDRPRDRRDRPAGTSGARRPPRAATKPSQPAGVTPAARPTSAPVINPFPSTPAGTPAAKPAAR